MKRLTTFKNRLVKKKPSRPATTGSDTHSLMSDIKESTVRFLLGVYFAAGMALAGGPPVKILPLMCLVIPLSY